MKEDPTGSFITALLELKLDKDTMFEWQKASQDARKIPHYNDLLNFIDLRAQASETCSSETKKHFPTRKVTPKSAAAFAANAFEATPNCFLCKTLKHPLYTCPQFKILPYGKMLSTIRSNNVCLNCLKPGHFSKNCGSNNRCRKCQKPHHTLLHIDSKSATDNKDQAPERMVASTLALAPMVSSYSESSAGSALLMICQML